MAEDFQDGEAVTDAEVCGAVHPNVPTVTCVLAVGPNATTDPVYKMVELPTGPTPELDENGNPIVLEEGHPVHVHKGYEYDGETLVCVHRWEDVPA